MRPTVSVDPLAEALALHRAGRPGEALAAGRAVLRRRPGDARAHHFVGTVLVGLGRASEAISHLETAARLQPAIVQPRLQAALALHQLGRLVEAGSSYRCVLASVPDARDAHCNLGLIEGSASRMARAVALRPDDPALISNFGALAASLRFLRRAVALAPGDAGLYLNLGNERRFRGDLDAAGDAYRRARDCGRLADGLANLALAAHDAGRLLDAVRWVRRSIAAEPAGPFMLSNASVVAKRIGWIGFAIRMARRSLACAASAEAWNNLGDALLGLGDLDAAAAAYRRCGEIGSASSWASNLLFCLCYDRDTTAKALHRIATEWARRYAPRGRPKPSRGAVSGRARVGVLSSDLRDHPVGRNVLGLFEHHREVELHAYAEVGRGDEVTDRFRAHADGWTSTVGLSDEEVAERMRREGLDLLVVLAGHTARNRPLVAAWGAAPVQASFHDLTTSGLGLMDWWVTDAVLHPEGTRERFTEKLWRLPHFYLHRPPEEAPEVGEVPSGVRGHVSFVSCNNPAKLTAEVVRLWSRVLDAVPGSRLLLKYKDWFIDEVVQARFRTMFERAGVGPERLDFRGGDLRRHDQLALLNEADVALDPFPFNGSTTSFEALWMGVPVVTLAGERFVGRVGASVLSALGLEELVASDEEGYVARAVALAEDRRRLADLRRSLRPRLAASPLCDAPGYTRTFEAALLGMLGGRLRSEG